LVEWPARLSCLTLAATCEDKEVTTIEAWLIKMTAPHAAAFIKLMDSNAGYCTPGKFALQLIDK